MKKLIIFIALIALVSCEETVSNNGTISVDPTIHDQGLVIKTARFNGHDYVYLKRIPDESGNWTHDPVCLMNDLDSLMNKHKNYNEYKE